MSITPLLKPSRTKERWIRRRLDIYVRKDYQIKKYEIL